MVPKGVLGQMLAKFHLLRFSSHPLLHLVQQILIHPAGDIATTLVAGALATSAGCVVLDVSALLDGLEAAGQLLPCRAPITIMLRVITKIALGEEPPLMAGGGVGLGDVGGIQRPRPMYRDYATRFGDRAQSCVASRVAPQDFDRRNC